MSSNVHASQPQAPRPAARLAALAVAASLLLSACAGLQPPLLPAASSPAEGLAPAAWAEAAGVSAASARPDELVRWWARFNDATLSTLVEQALQRNTSVAVALANLQQARAERDAAAAGLLPTLTASGSVQRSKSGNTSAVTSHSAGLDASWEPDFFGAKRSTLSASDAAAQAQAATLGDVQVSVSAEVALAFINLRSTQARLAIAQANLASQQGTLQITQWRQQAGLATVLDTQQATTAVEQLRAALPPLQTAAAQYRHALAVLTGQPPAALDATLAASAPVPQPAGDLALALPADTLRQRADVRAAELNASAAYARVQTAQAQRLPQFSLSGSLGLQALTLGGLGAGGALVSQLLASVAWPVFDGGTAQAQVRVQQAALDSARASWQAAVLTALQDVEDALVALRNDRERQARLQAASSAAAQAATLARQRYASGLIDFQTVLETQRSQLSAEDSLATSTADLSADHVRLFKALGGGWQPTPNVLVGGGWQPTTTDQVLAKQP